MSGTPSDPQSSGGSGEYNGHSSSMDTPWAREGRLPTYEEYLEVMRYVEEVCERAQRTQEIRRERWRQQKAQHLRQSL